MKKILNRLTQYETLTEKESRNIIIKISEGKLNTSEISSFLTIFMIRNITIEELNGFRKALIELSLKIDLNEFEIALPIPEEAPVIKIRFPFRLVIVKL